MEWRREEADAVSPTARRSKCACTTLRTAGPVGFQASLLLDHQGRRQNLSTRLQSLASSHTIAAATVVACRFVATAAKRESKGQGRYQGGRGRRAKARRLQQQSSKGTKLTRARSP